MRTNARLAGWLAATVTLVAAGGVHAQAVHYVRASATGANDGTSWADAFTDLQSALTAAQPGDRVWVAAGTYQPTTTTDRTVSFVLRPGVAVYGGFSGTEDPATFDLAGRDFIANETVLSGDLLGNDIGSVAVDEPTRQDNSYHVVAAAVPDATLDGFTITGGQANGDELDGFDRGGGLYITDNPVVAWCSFRGNAAASLGGAVALIGVQTFAYCDFVGNHAPQGGAIAFQWPAECNLFACSFTGNTADYGGAVRMVGDFWQGVSAATLRASYCTFDGNEAAYEGGAISADVYGNLDLEGCTFETNRSADALSNASGGAISMGMGNHRLDECTFRGNTAPYQGGGIYCTAGGAWAPSLITMTRCTFTDNSSWFGGALAGSAVTIHEMSECSFAGNVAEVGGAIQILGFIPEDRAALRASNCIFIENGTFTHTPWTHEGGAIAAWGHVDVDLDSCLFEANHVTNTVWGAQGGALWLSVGHHRLAGCTFLNNAAVDGRGDTVYLRGESYIGEDWSQGSIEIDEGVVFEPSAAPPGETAGGDVIIGTTVNLRATFSVSAGRLDVNSIILDGPGNLHLSPEAVFVVAAGFVDPEWHTPTIVRTRVTGTGTIEIQPGQQLIVEGQACIDLRPDGVGQACVDPGGQAGGQILIDGILLARGQSRIQNARIQLRQAEIHEDGDIQYNDIYLLDAISTGGELFVEDTATIAYNVIRSMGDRYLDLDPDPQSTASPNIIGNTIHVQIRTNQALPRGTLLELRARDYECDPGGVNPTCASGAYPAAVIGRFTDPLQDPAGNWVLETLEILPGAKLNLSNRAGFRFRTDSPHPETVYVKQLILHPGAVLNTALQTLYYESLTDENGTPLDPEQPLPDGRQIVDEPLLGFSLAIIAMNDTTPSPFNEFDVRIRQRRRDPADEQDCRCDGTCPGNFPPKDPTTCKEGAILHLHDVRGPGDGVMEMRTRGIDLETGEPNRLPGGSVAAKGAFARAGDEDIVVMFEYLFREVEPGTKINVYLSDKREAGERIFKVAELTPPPPLMLGGTASNEFALFMGQFPRVVPGVYELNFTRGTYVELELVADEPGGVRTPGEARVWIDNFDPQVWCSGLCGTFDNVLHVEDVDYLILLAEAGQSIPGGKWCLDITGDGYVDFGDLLAWDVVYNEGYDLCSRPVLGACCLGSGECALDTPYGCQQVSGSYQGDGTTCDPDPCNPPTAAEGLHVASPQQISTPGHVLKVLAKPCVPGIQDDLVYSVDAAGSCPEPGESLPCAYCDRGAAGLIRDGTGREYVVHGVYGVLDLETGAPLVSPHAAKPFNGGSVSIGLDPWGEGVSLLDAAFAPGDSSEAFIYVVPVVVTPPGGGHTYKAAAKLQLQGDGDYEVAAIFGIDPADDPDPCANASVTCDAGWVRPLCDLSGVRELEIDPDGNIYVASASHYNDNDWLLIYNESTGTPTSGYEIARVNLKQVVTGGAFPVPHAPAALRVSTHAAGRLYLTGSADASAGLVARVYRFAFEVDPPRLTWDGVVEIAQPIPAICGPVVCEDYMVGITAIQEAPTGDLYVMGFSAPRFPANEPLDPAVDAIFTTPALAVVPAACSWATTGPPTVIQAAVITGTDPTLPLALPISALLDAGHPADLNGDGLVDAGDFAIFAACMTGASVPYDSHNLSPGCSLTVDLAGLIAADLDRDGDVDQSDFGRFQRCLSGPDQPADLNCAR